MIKAIKDLAKSILNGDDYIEIEGDLQHKVIKIKATGNIAWAVAIGGISVAIIGALKTVGTGGVAAPVGTANIVGGASAATAVLGLPTATTAIYIGIAGGGVSVLNKLRKYNIEEHANKVILRKK